MQTVGTLLRKWLEETGSTRAPALIRVGLAFLLWLTWGDDFTLFKLHDAESVVVGGLFYVATGAMLVGLKARLSTTATGLVAAYIYYKLGVFGGNEHFVHHHTALLIFATLICAMTPCGASFSVDRWLATRRGDNYPEVGPLWALRLLSLLVSVVYLGGAVSKTNMGWLSGDRLEQIFTHFYGNSAFPASSWLESFSIVATAMVVLLEYALVVGLWMRRTRRFLVPLGIGLHVSFYILLPVETFSLTMLLLYISFAPSIVDRLGERFFSTGTMPKRAAPARAKKRTPRRHRRGMAT